MFCSIGTSRPWITDSPPLLFILNIITTGIRELVLVENFFKILKAKDHDVQKIGTKVEQREFSCIDKIDEDTYRWYW